uniref:ABC transmembrane type-1 domain-containing protein n=1 Tax=Plectus sambesii TaxID=2011161 RepID=A0A914WG91_9BILA
MRDQNYSFGWLFFQRLGRLAPTLFPALYSSATLFVLATLATSICSEVVGYYIGLAPSKFIVALGGRDQPTFWRWFMWGSLMFFGKCLCIAGVEFFSWLLYTSWRRNIDSALHVNYFKNFAFYRVNCLEYADGSQIDNPDQRITQDVERMTQQLAVNILPAALIGPFVVVFYTYKTWTTAGWLGVSLIYAYFLIGTTVNKLLISPMVKWVARQEKMEGNFRFKHVSVRTNAESIAFYRGEQFENAESDQHLNLLLKTQVRLIAWRLPIRFWQQFFDYYGSMISYAIQLIPIFVLNEYDGLSGLDLTGKISEVRL